MGIDPLLGGKANPLSSRGGMFRPAGSTSTPYRQHQNESESINDETCVGRDESMHMTNTQYRQGVVNRLGVNQERWKRQVEIQRSSVYDRHTMLNWTAIILVNSLLALQVYT